MFKRIVTGIVLALIAVPVCIYSDTFVFPLVIAILSLIGTFEMLSCVGMKKRFSVCVPLCAFAFAFPLLARYITPLSSFLAIYGTALFALLLAFMALQVFIPDKVSATSVSTAFVCCVYVITGFVSIILLRDMEAGVYYFMIPLVAPLTCDIFAYFCGVLFGKHKLIPKISPKKTVEGSIGGMFFCTVICTVYGVIIRNALDVEVVLPIWSFALGGLLISVVSQIGDLIASAIKRQYDIKDYGKIFPGHGGVLDRFDSVIGTVPLFLILVIILHGIGV